MNMQINIENLKEIYLVSNTASFLFNAFSKEESILELHSKYSQEQLMNQFEKITRLEINTVDDLVMAYSIYIAILQFDNERVFDFLKKEGDINFEWFS